MISWRALDALSRAEEPLFRRAFLEAAQRIRDRATLSELASILETGNADAVLRRLNISPADFGLIGNGAQETFRRAAVAVAEEMTVGGVAFSGSLDLLNSRSVDFLQRYKLNLITGVTNDTRTAIRQVITNAFQEGGHPYEQARAIREVIGLTPRQATAVDNFRSALEAEDRAPAQVNRMVGNYAARQLRARAETIARTETLRASNAGQQEVWRQAVEAGFIDARESKRQWIVTPDDRLCEICSEIPDLNPGGVGQNEPFQTSIGPVMSPPAHPNCRCAVALDVGG